MNIVICIILHYYIIINKLIKLRNNYYKYYDMKF